MLNFNNIQKYASIKMTHKILNNTAPAPLKNFIKYTSAVSSRSTRASTTGQCNIPRLKTTFAQSAFSYKAIKDWNDLPTTLKTQTDYLTFSTEGDSRIKKAENRFIQWLQRDLSLRCVLLAKAEGVVISYVHNSTIVWYGGNFRCTVFSRGFLGVTHSVLT